ncbi:GntR family transcriptional regulator [Saccharibacillus sp. O23]|uniref:MocR-like pyridoxine biosynthesis transcription factor PdxR n=1 Tax=Saccharibacillus sp. O23 TaxID=2009338 RepID=UPI000B4E45F9|nr:PLP-dependent aminotransferase family protein [Saccharibacillus sp. O23]OWR32588.1 GntR family transcriptional regulator [Saccharibacillus sp. O23]
MLEITPLLTKHSAGSSEEEPLYLQLYDHIKTEIRGGRISAGSRLPSQRRLALHLSVSRNTVDSAYQQLLSEGYLYSEPRRGLFVAELPDLKTQPHTLSEDAKTSAQVRQPAPVGPDSHAMANRMIPAEKNRFSSAASETPSAKYDFRNGSVDARHFPYRLWRQFSISMLSADNARLLQYGHPQGELELRRQIADYLYQSRGVHSSAEQIVIGAGTQWLLDILCRLLGRDTLYGMEEPGYPRVRTIFEDCGRPPAAIRLDDSGVRIDELLRSGAQAVYVTPSHQFPTGIVMPVSRRLELIEWAKTHGGTIIEDDYDSEFRYEGRPIPSLHSLDHHGNTVYLGTFSKSLMPSVRIGYLVLPDKLMDVYRRRGHHYKQTASRMDQHTLTMFMQSGEWARHLNRMRNLYKKRYTALHAAIRSHMGTRMRVIGASSGLHLLLEPNNGMTEQELIASAEQAGVRVYPVEEFHMNRPEQAQARVLLGYAGLSEEEIGEGIKRLAEAWR